MRGLAAIRLSPLVHGVLGAALGLGPIFGLAAGCGSDQPPVEITFITTVSGDLSGDLFHDSVVLALDEINAAGGIGGRPVTLVTFDDGSTPDGSTRAYSEALLRVSPVILGPTYSQGVVAVADLIRNGDTLTLSGSTTSPLLSTTDFAGNFFRTCPSDAVQGVVLADLVREAGVAQLCIVHRNDAYGDGLAAVIADSLAGDVVIADAGYDPSASSLAQVLVDCEGTRMSGAPGIIFVTYEVDGLTLLDDAAVRGWDAQVQKVFLVDANRSQQLLDGLADPAALEGAVGTAPSGPDPSTPAGARFRGFRDRFQEAFHVLPDVLTENMYDAAYLGVAAIAAAGGPDDRAAIGEAVAQLQAGTEAPVGDWRAIADAIERDGSVDIQGASGELTLDLGSGDLLPPYFIQVWRVAGAQIVIDHVVDVNEAPIIRQIRE